MPIRIRNKPQITGILVLFVGVALLAFTFINAFMFLQEPVSIIAAADLAMVFGEALAPLIQACIRLMYLGIMGWIGSLLTVRGIPLVTQKTIPLAAPIAESQPKPVPKPEKVTQPPAPKPKQTTSTQAKNTAPSLNSQPNKTQLIPEPKQEEPRAILIPPSNQKEE
jgi:hypothetical protein